MDVFEGLITGFQTVLSPVNFLFCFIGVFIGTLVGVLPGIGPVGAMSILLPTTYGLSPVSSIIMLAGIFYGAMYGGSTTSILVNIPGEAASVITCLDGYQMARKGRAGPALGISALGSFIGGTFSVFALVFLVHQGFYGGRDDLFDSPVGAVAEAVNNDYYFVRVSDFFKGIFQSFYISDDCFGLAVRGDNNGKKVVITVGHGNKTAADGF